MIVCGWCGDEFNRPNVKGPEPKYCKPSHRQRAYEARSKFPVEPDYEAAWAYARQEDNGYLAAKKHEDLVVLDKFDVMALVDVAYIGEDSTP